MKSAHLPQLGNVHFYPQYNQPTRAKISKPCRMSDSLRNCPVVPLWQELFKDDRHVLFEGVAHRPAAFIEGVQDPHRDREPLLRLGLLDQALHRVQSIKEHPLTGSGDVAEQAAFDRVEFRTIGRGVRHTDRYGQVVDDALQVFLEHVLVTTVTATAITEEQD